MQKLLLRYRFIGGFVLLLIIGLVSFKPPFASNDRYFDIAKNLDIFATLYKEVNRYYVDDINPTQLINSGIKGMLETLDPYTNYISEDDLEDYRTMTTGEYGGIGADIGNRDGRMMVLLPYKGFPAEKAGLQIGDEIIEIDGISTLGKDIEDISKLLRGQAGTEVKLLVKRYKQPQTLKITLVREKIQIPNVPYSGMITENIGLIQLTEFTREASKEVKQAFLDLKSKGATKIVLDLRGNPGGLLSEAINISNLFLPKGVEVVSTKGKIEEWNKSHLTLNSPLDLEIPIVILVNGTSASASEIVSGVLQDYDRGVVIGKRTFGKGLVQATRSLSFNSKLKVTVAKYYIPSGRCIQEIDYSHRNLDGTTAKMPDSLRTAFKTKNGRTVYDGGGILPDIQTKPTEYAPITQELLNKFLILDYASEYKLKNPSLVKDFKFSDADYEDFKKWLADKSYYYETPAEKMLNQLIDSVRASNEYNELKPEIEALKLKIAQTKKHDLDKYKNEIIPLLRMQIAAHYFYHQGQVEESFKYDDDVKEAIALLNNPSRYQQILRK